MEREDLCVVVSSLAARRWGGGTGRVSFFLKCRRRDHSVQMGLHEDAVRLYMCKGTIHTTFSALCGLC